MLYKYRGIKELRYFVDIVLNQRLHAAPYFDLNDPMEGHYLYNKGELDSDVRNLIKGQKQKLRICSLSKVNDNVTIQRILCKKIKNHLTGFYVIFSKFQCIRKRLLFHT